MKNPFIAATAATRSAVSVLALAAALAGCGEKGPRAPAHREGIDPAPEAQAPTDISGSFLVEATEGKAEANRARIAIAKESLGKEFLLQSGLTIMPYLGTSNGNLSRIVTFRVIDGALWMFEATEGKTATQDIPQTFVLAKFPIKFKSETHIYFDFNAGMTDLLVGEEWRASDFSGTDVKYDAKAIKTSLSYLESATISDKNELVVRQIAQVDMPQGSVGGDATSTTIDYTQDHTTIEVRYYLTPYAPSAAFVPTVSPGFGQYGYFEVAPRYDANGESVVHATKFADGDITYAISANTPAEVRDAVKDGILYWNKILGADRVKVVDAPAGATAPDFNHNIVQWVTWDSAGFAYADAQADPRTGQTLHAQVYMTSVFWVSGKKSAKTWLERVGAESAGGGTAPHTRPSGRPSGRPSIGLKGFQGGHLCLADKTEDLKKMLTQLVAEDATDAQIQKVTGDYIREVVAHEIGHTLGLRHNFAGSLAANFPVSELETTFRDYARTGVASADKITSSSVMEYQTFLNSTMTGDQLVSRPLALPYDIQAISFLYTGQVPSDSTPVPFCTDTLESVFADCKVFDEGASVPASLVRAFRSSTRLLGQSIPMGTGPNDPSVPLVYFLDADLVAELILAPIKDVAAMASGKTRLFGVRHDAGLPAGLEPMLRQAERDKLLQDVTAAGGFDVVLPLQPAMPDAGIPDYAPAKENLETRVTAKLLDILAQPEQISDHGIGQAFATHLAKMTRLVALTEGATPLTVTVTAADGTQSTLTLPTFKYATDLRTKASALLKPGRGESLAFALDESLAVKAELVAKLNTALGSDVTTVDLATLPSEARRWVVENRTVLEGFGR